MFRVITHYTYDNLCHATRFETYGDASVYFEDLQYEAESYGDILTIRIVDMDTGATPRKWVKSCGT